MPKKKKVDIAKQLHALKPSIPTRTRITEPGIINKSELKESTEPESVYQPPFGAILVLYENIAVMEKIRWTVLEDTKRFQELAFESFTNIMNMLYETMHTNINFASAFFQRINQR